MSHPFCYNFFFFFFLQWDQLLCLFDAIEEDSRDDLGLASLQEATTKFQEVVRSIREEPQVFFLVVKKKGRKGFRELQGETLRRACKSILNTIVSSKNLKKKWYMH